MIIQQVVTTEGDLVDVVGYPSPEVELTGTGKAWILRDGKLIVGTWSAAGEGAVTKFVHEDRRESSRSRPATRGSSWRPGHVHRSGVAFAILAAPVRPPAQVGRYTRAHDRSP